VLVDVGVPVDVVVVEVPPLTGVYTVFVVGVEVTFLFTVAGPEGLSVTVYVVTDTVVTVLSTYVLTVPIMDVVLVGPDTDVEEDVMRFPELS
jgi:hypothetical protein